MCNLFNKKQIPDSTMPHFWEDEDEIFHEEEKVESNCPTWDSPSAEISFLILAVYLVMFVMLVVFALALIVKL